FHALHHRQHGHSARDAAVQIVSYRLRARVKTNKISLQAHAQAPANPAFEGLEPERDVRFGSDDTTRTPVIPRSEVIRTGACTGPTIVVQFDTTTVIPRGWTARADASGNMIVERSTRG